MNTNMIETNRISLDTMAVEIRALHVGAKQMTLAVFRQLPTAYAYRGDGSLDPKKRLWGIVRYAIKDDADVWVICDVDGILYRCPAYWHGLSVQTSIHALNTAKAIVSWWLDKKNKTWNTWKNPPYGAPKWDENSLPSLEKEVADCEADIVCAKNAETAQRKILQMTQLFIAL